MKLHCLYYSLLFLFPVLCGCIDSAVDSDFQISLENREVNTTVEVDSVGGIAVLVKGSDFNALIKRIANGGAENVATDNHIREIRFVCNSTATDGVDISDRLLSECPIYAIYETGILTIHTSAEKIYASKDMSQMFIDCPSLTTLDLSGFDTGNVTDMSEMFYGCSALTTLDLSGFDTGNVTNMSDMFCGCNSLTTLDVSGFDTGNVTNMSGMFNGCPFTTLDLSGFDTRNVTNMFGMFESCTSLTTLDVSGFDTGNVTDMYGMFFQCFSLTSLDVSGFDTGNVTNMWNMFCWCFSLTTLDVSGFDTRNVTNMSGMFNGCPFTTLDLSGFDTRNVTNMFGMFSRCSSLNSLDLGKHFIIRDDTDKDGMCSGLAQDSYSCTISCLSDTRTALSSGTDLETQYITWNILD